MLVVRSAPRRRRELAARWLVLVLAASLVVAYALPGGAYDIVVRQEYGLAAWVLLALGFATGVLPRARPSRGSLIVLGALVVVAAWTGLSLAWSDSAERTTAELARVVAYVGVAALVASLLDRTVWRAALTGLTVGAMIVCALSVASRLYPAHFPANVVGVMLQTKRLSYPFGYWNAVGAWGAMTVALGLGWAASDGSRLRRMAMLAGVPIAGTMVYLSFSRAGVAGVALAIALTVVLGRHRWTAILQALLAGFATAITIAVIREHPAIEGASGSRGGSSVLLVIVFAGAMCAAGAWLLALARSDAWRLPGWARAPVAAACLIAVIVLGAAFGPHLASRAWRQFRHPVLAGESANTAQRLTSLSGTRYDLWAVAVDEFARRPLTGNGAGTYEFVWNRHARDGEFVLNAHSLWFETMAELGVFGLLAIVVFAAAALALLLALRRRAHRRTSVAAAAAAASCFAVFLWQASVDWMWQSTAVTVLALAVLAASTVRFSTRPVRLVPIWRVALAALALAAAGLQLPGLLGTLHLRASESAEARGNGALALAQARAAVSAEPWAASPHEQMSLVLEAAGRYAAAAVQERLAVDAEPDDYAHWLILARIRLEQGRIGIADSDYAHARSLRPRGEIFDISLITPQLAAEADRLSASGG